MTTRKIELASTHDFYKLLHEIMERLVGAQAAEMDKSLDDCLEKVGKFFNVSQVGLGQWSKAGEILPSLRSWGAKPVDDYLTTVGPGPQAFKDFCRRGFLVWNCLEDLERLPRFQDHWEERDLFDASAPPVTIPGTAPSPHRRAW